jgi:hypothetical protein
MKKAFSLIEVGVMLFLVALLCLVGYQIWWDFNHKCVHWHTVHYQASTTVTFINQVPVYHNHPAYDSEVCDAWEER